MELDDKEPVLVYWVDLQNPKSRASDRRWKRVELNAVEKRLAYGVTIHGFQQTAASSAGSGDEASSLMSVDFSIRAIPTTRIKARLTRTSAHALLNVAAEWCRVHSVDARVDRPSLFNLNPRKWVKTITVNAYNASNALVRKKML